MLKMKEDSDVMVHLRKMTGFIQRSETNNLAIDNCLQMDMILLSLPDSCTPFMADFQIIFEQCTIENLAHSSRYQRQDEQ